MLYDGNVFGWQYCLHTKIKANSLKFSGRLTKKTDLGFEIFHYTVQKMNLSYVKEHSVMKNGNHLCYFNRMIHINTTLNIKPHRWLAYYFAISVI